MAGEGGGGRIATKALLRQPRRRSILFVLGSAGRTTRGLMDNTFAEILHGALGLGRGEHGMIVMVVGSLGGGRLGGGRRRKLHSLFKDIG